MVSFVLVYPVERAEFYVNPFRLQLIEAKLRNWYGEDSVDVELVDANEPERYAALLKRRFDCAIVEAPEGALLELVAFADGVHADYVLVTGDLVEYGDPHSVNAALESAFPTGYETFASDQALPSFLLNHFRLAMRPSKPCLAPARSVELGFPQWMGELHQRFGIQVHMEGLTRGCENQCSFCRVNSSDSHFGTRDTCVNAVATIARLADARKRIPYVQFVDENFFGKGRGGLERVSSFCDSLEASGCDAAFGIDTRLDTIMDCEDTDDEARMRESVWSRFAELGLKYCFIGFETAASAQSARYRKGIDVSQFGSAIAVLEKLGIEYTIGLILWDPLMSVEELAENLDFLEENNLIGRTASLLKPLRVQVQSRYLHEYGEEFLVEPVRCSDGVTVDYDSIRFKDGRIREILPITLRYYRLFAQCGYRHSDVACFNVVLDDDGCAFLRGIPRLVSSFEFDLLRELTDPGVVINELEVVRRYDELCATLVADVLEGLSGYKCGTASPEADAVFRYYWKAFARVKGELD